MLQGEYRSEGPVARKLHFVRLPGLYGPVVRLIGRLDQANRDEFGHLVKLLAPLGHRAIVLNLRSLEHLDSAGFGALASGLQAWRLAGTRPVLVTGTASIARLLSLFGLDRQVVTVATEAEATDTLEFLFEERALPDRTWMEAQREALEWWQNLEREMEVLPPQATARKLTGMHALCEKSEDAVRFEGMPGLTRCELCPLFHALGGCEADLGCGRVVDPILTALARSDVRAAGEGVHRMIEVLEQIDFPAARGQADERDSGHRDVRFERG
jgi:anti-anti-sigma factor